MNYLPRTSAITLVLMIVAAALVTTARGTSQQAIPLEQQDTGNHVYLPLIATPSWFENIANGAEVAQTMTLIGTYPPAASDDLWIFVAPPNNRYYPQSLDACHGVLTPRVGGRWEMRVGFGQPNNVNQQFRILLTTASPSASQFIRDTLKAWCQANDYPGFEQLPMGVKLWQQISVKRTSVDWGPAPDPSNARLPGAVAITKPANGDLVSQVETVMGTYTPDATADIWVLVYATNGRWYPQSYNACADDHVHKGNGHWDVRASFGGPNNIGEPFDIVAVLADGHASDELGAKQQEWCENSFYPGWLTIELPRQIDRKAWVRVIRK